MALAGNNRTWCVECEMLRKCGCRYSLCPLTTPVPARGHMPFERSRTCAEWMGVAAVRETPRGGELQTDSGHIQQEAIARSHEAVDNS